MQSLVVVESPTKAKTLNRFLGKDYEVLSSMGHLRDLPPKKIGIKVEGAQFIPEYVLLEPKKEAANKIKRAAKKAKRVFLASVNYDEPILIRFPNGLVRLVKVGNFIDNIIEKKIKPAKYQVAAFDSTNHKITFRSLKGVSRHPINEDLLEVVLDYGRRIKITTSHSVFTKDQNDRIKLVEGKRLQVGDRLLVPLNLPRSSNEIKQIDLLKEVYQNPEVCRQVFINSPFISKYRKGKILAQREGDLPQFQERVWLSRSLIKNLILERNKRGWSQKLLANKIDCSQSNISDWEKRRKIPTLSLAEKYFALLGVDLQKAFERRQVKLLRSSLEMAIKNAVENQWRDSRKSLNRTYQPLFWFSWEEIEKHFSGDNKLKISRHNHSHFMPRFISVNRDLMLFLGFFLAEGSFLDKGKYLRFSFGKKDIGGEKKNIERVKKACIRLFNLKPCEFEEKTTTTLTIKSTLVSFFIREILNIKGRAGTKKIPWVVFNVSGSLQLAFLEGLFLGDGSLRKDAITFNTISSELAWGLRFLLLQNGFLSSYSLAFSKKPNRKPLQQVTITSRERLSETKQIWRRHYNARRLENYLKEGNYKDSSLVERRREDLGLLKVKSIKKVKPSKNSVYDFSVEGENFICGNGAICAHNTDPDREGEAIAWHIESLLGKKKAIRVSFHEITKTAIKKALAKPGEIDMKLVDAQQARRVLDRLVGYKLSPLLWRKIRRGLSAGRVQSVAVRLVSDREREIEKFVPDEYWDIGAELRRHIGGKKEGAPKFVTKLASVNGEKVKVENEKQAKKIITDLEKANYEVAAVEKKETMRQPLPPFTTSTMQQKAAQTMRFSSKRTMRAAQGLYEKGLITYHRTDSLNLAQEAQEKIRLYINSTYGEKYLPEQPRFYKTKSKVAQEAHEAIRPTKMEPVPSGLARDGARLYGLIFKRAIACQMTPAIWDQTKVKIQAGSEKDFYLLTTEGKVIKFDGWLASYGGIKDKDEQLPKLNKGDDLDLIKVLSEQKFTQPPARFNEASLIKTLEEKGIGRPSTYAPIISTIQARQYVEKKEGRFYPTALGLTTNDFLVEYFPKIMNYEFTAQMEDNLDDIARGKHKWMPVVAEFYTPFKEKLSAVTKVAERVQVPTEATGEDCPECKKGSLVIRVGRFGKFISCSRFPDCKYTAPFVAKLDGVACPKCKGDIVIKKTKKGKQFYGCSNWPKCDWASWRKPR